MWNWDYDLPKDWQPKTDAEWEWFLVRKLRYSDFEGLTKKVIAKYFPHIRKRLNPDMETMLARFFGL